MPAEELLPFDLDNATGPQLKALRQAIVATFTPPRLSMLLSEELSRSFHALVGNGPFDEQVWQLLDTAKREGWLGELVHQAIETSPKAPALRRFLETFELLRSRANASAAPARHRATAAHASAPDSPPRSTSGMGASALERLIDSPNDYFDLERLGDTRNRVCRIKGKGLLSATGCLVGPDLVLTCAYVLNGVARVAEEIAVQFDFVVNGDQPAPGREYPLHPVDWRVASSPMPQDISGAPDAGWNGSLDFVLLRLATPAGEEILGDDDRRGWMDLEVDPQPLAVGELLFMLHHPKAGPMQMSAGQVLATGHGDSRIWHNVPSEPGSGGAPVFDRRLRLVGLHELGMAKPDGRTHLAAVRADHIAMQLQVEGLLPPKRGFGRSVAAPDSDN